MRFLVSSGMLRWAMICLALQSTSRAWVLSGTRRLVHQPSMLLSTTQAFSSASTSSDSGPFTTALLRISYDGGRFTGWSAANDHKDISTVSDPPPENILIHTGRNRRRRAARRATKGFVRSVQGVIQLNLAKLYGNVDPARVVVEGCSRTDKGVHARCLIAQVYCLTADYETANIAEAAIPGKRLPHPRHATDTTCFEPLPMKNLTQLGFTLNRMLPGDVRVMAVCPVPSMTSHHGDIFHATRSAVSKTYVYTLSVGPIHDPTQRRHTWHAGTIEDDFLDRLQEAADLLRGKHDFAAFQGAPRGVSDKLKRQQQNTTCTLMDISITQPTSSWLETCQIYSIAITGDRFLYKMVRFLVGTLVAVATRQATLEDVQTALDLGRQYNSRLHDGVISARTCAPAHGLVLQDVNYDVPLEWQSVNS